MGKKPPPQFEYPPEFICKWCGDPRPNHCTRHIKAADGTITIERNPHCTWYPCKPCKVVTILGGPTQVNGRWRWDREWVTVHPKFFL